MYYIIPTNRNIWSSLGLRSEPMLLKVTEPQIKWLLRNIPTRPPQVVTRQICTKLFKSYKVKTKQYQNQRKRLNDENKRLTIREKPLTEALSADIILLRECVIPPYVINFFRKETGLWRNIT